MYQFSRSIYRELAPRISTTTNASCASKQQILSACEGTMRRLLTDRRYFARPTKALFTELRGHFPISEQLFVFQVVDRNVKLAIRYLDEVPAERARPARRAGVQGPHATGHALPARAAAGPRLLPLPQAPRGRRRWSTPTIAPPRRRSSWSPEPPARCNGRVLLGVDVGGTFTDAVLLDGDRIEPRRRRPRPTTSRAGWPRRSRPCWSLPARDLGTSRGSRTG